MFGAITEKFKGLFASLSGKKSLTESNIAEAVTTVRLALLDADVNYGVVSQFVKRVKEKALGDAVIKAVTPGDQFVKLIHDELVELMGKEEAKLELQGSPAVILLCGLQGAGKTTQCAKLAAFLQQKKGYQKKVLVAACDLQRPAAVEQLKTLCAAVPVSFFALEGEKNPVRVAKEALEKAKKEQFDVLIVDTAGRLHVDGELMVELAELKRVLNPQEVLFVASSATGQDAVKTAQEFDQRIGITGSILTMLDGTARAGAALSIQEVTKKPLKFEGIGEKIGDLQLFNPRSMADRILGMGDVINLVRKAEEQYDEEKSKELEKKIRKSQFTYKDYLSQMGMVKKMGPLKGLLQMLPGAAHFPQLENSEKEFKKIEAIMGSMTPDELEERVDLIPQRRWRIAKGSGTTIDEVNRLVKGFRQMKEMMKHLPKAGKGLDLANFKENFKQWR